MLLAQAPPAVPSVATAGRITPGGTKSMNSGVMRIHRKKFMKMETPLRAVTLTAGPFLHENSTIDIAIIIIDTIASKVSVLRVIVITIISNTSKIFMDIQLLKEQKYDNIIYYNKLLSIKMNAYNQQDKNIRKTWFLMFIFLFVVIGIGWAFSYIYDNQIILYIAVAFSLFMNVFSYWYSDKIVLKMSGAKPATREAHRELWNIVENLSITAGLPMPKLYIINDQSPNAFATGRDKEHAAVAVTSGLLNILDRTELEGVIAHELSHIGNRDILLQTVVVVLVGFVTLLSDFFLRMTFWGGMSGRGRGGDGKIQLILIVAGIALSILAPLIAMAIQLAISRKREFLADSSGALLTRYPEGLASALEKISNSSHELKKANHATAHMYIANPFKGKHTKGFMAKLFMTHPDPQERIKILRGLSN